MLMLIFNIENERYAIDSHDVLEVIPLVHLKTLPHSSAYFAGVFNYHGSILPVIDLCQLMHGKRSCEYLSTRIILVKYWGSKRTVASNPQVPQMIGLMAEKVVETLHTSDIDLVDIDIRVNRAPYLGKIIVNNKSMIQCLNIDYLFSEKERINLFSENNVENTEI